MKSKQLLILLVVLLLLGGAALWLSQRQRAEWSSSAARSDAKVLDFPVNDVSHLAIKGAGEAVNLTRKEDVWTVQERADYPADFEKVGSLVRKLWELKPVQEVKVGPSQLGRLQLTSPSAGSTSGTLIELKGAADKRLAALLLGKNQLRENQQFGGPGGGFPVGRYVMAENGANRVVLVSETFADVQLKPEQWLNRDFFKIENPKLIRLTSPAPAMSWTLTRENLTSPWKLADAKPGEEFDANKASSLGTLFNVMAFSDVLAPNAAPLDQPTVAHLETFDGFTYEMQIGKVNGENYPVRISVAADLPKERTPAADEKPEDKPRLDQEFAAKQKQLTDKLAKEQKLPDRQYLIAKTTIDQLLKERSAFMAEKPTPPPSPVATTTPAPPAKPKPSPPKR